MARVPHKGFDLLGSRASQPDFDSFEMQSLAHEVDVAQRMRGRRQIVRTGGAAFQSSSYPLTWVDGIAEVDADYPAINKHSDGETIEFSATDDAFGSSGKKFVLLHFEQPIVGPTDRWLVAGLSKGVLDVDESGYATTGLLCQLGYILESFDYTTINYTDFNALSKGGPGGFRDIGYELEQRTVVVVENANEAGLALAYSISVSGGASLHGVYLRAYAYNGGYGGTVNEASITLMLPGANEIGAFCCEF